MKVETKGIYLAGGGSRSSIEEATASMVHIRDCFSPDMEVHKIYSKIYNDIYTKIFNKLKPLYNINKGMEEK